MTKLMDVLVEWGATAAAKDKMFLTEIMNDLHRNGFRKGGKADSMLRDWAQKLREEARPVLKPSKLRAHFNKVIGKENW